MELIDRIKQNARKHNMRIVLPEAYEERNLRAADIAIEEGLAQIILIGDPAGNFLSCRKTWIKEYFESHDYKSCIASEERALHQYDG